jgi:hypothetical protein
MWTVAHLRQIGILSRLSPFVDDEPAGKNMDMYPDKDGSPNGRLSASSNVPSGRLFARQERINRAQDGREATARDGVPWDADVNQQTWPASQMAWTGGDRLSRPRWDLGGI